MKALIMVDLQNDFMPGGALAVPRGDEVVPLANQLQPLFPLVLATQDWHPPDHRSFAANHPSRRPGERVLLDGIEQILWPVHCVQHTPGAAFFPALDRSRIAAVFQKGTDPRIRQLQRLFRQRAPAGHRAGQLPAHSRRDHHLPARTGARLLREVQRPRCPATWVRHLRDRGRLPRDRAPAARCG